jgi:hypothetical protein
MSVPHAFDRELAEKIAGQLHGAAGPGGMDARLCHMCFTQFGTASENFRTEWALISEWITKESPLFAAYLALNTKRALGLRKEADGSVTLVEGAPQGTWPIAIGEILMRSIGKSMLVKG